MQCYTFRSGSIPEHIETFSVQNFRLTAQNAPANIDIDFTEALKDKIRNNSRLQLSASNPDVVYSGNVTNFRVESVAPAIGELVEINRLHIAVSVSYEDKTDKKKNWQQNFTYFSEYPVNEVLADVQDALLQEIFEQITEDIFNKSFGDW